MNTLYEIFVCFMAIVAAAVTIGAFCGTVAAMTVIVYNLIIMNRKECLKEAENCVCKLK